SLVETATGGSRLALEGTQGKAASVSLLPGGRGLTGEASGLMRLWDLRSGKALAEKSGPTTRISSQSGSRDGRLLVTGLEGTTAVVWDMVDWRKAAAAERPLEKPTEEEAWLTLSGDADRAHVMIERLLSHPDVALRLFRERLKEASPIDRNKLSRLLAQLDD